MASPATTTSAPNDDDSSPSVSYEQILLSIAECFVYKVPPLRTASGHRAEDWGLASPLFTGFLRMTQTDTRLKILVYAYRDPTKLLASEENLVLFGECPVEVPPKGDVTAFVDSVIDSSRYYVLRIKDPKSSRTTLLGVGFRDREVSFDFKNVLNEYVRYVDRADTAKKLAERRAAGDLSADAIELIGGGHARPDRDSNTNEDDDDDDEAGEVARGMHALSHKGLDSGRQDLTLKERITLPLPAGRKGEEGNSRRQKRLASFGSFGTIAPPPAPGSTVFSSVPVVTSPAQGAVPVGGAGTVGDDEEWGSFDEADAPSTDTPPTLQA